MPHKVTLYIADDIIKRAKLFSKYKGISLSGIVEDYLRHLTEPAGMKKKYIADELVGILNDSGSDTSMDYKKVKKSRLKKKYGL